MHEDARLAHSEAPDCSEVEEALNYYVDGELPSELQSELFRHLSTCDDCRKIFEAILAFRRMSRQEKISVPLAADDALMERLATKKKRSALVNRRADRNPLWETRKPVSIGAAVLACLVIFVAGILISDSSGMNESEDAIPESVIEGIQEAVHFDEPTLQPQEAIYVFYPGITVEAERQDDADPDANP